MVDFGLPIFDYLKSITRAYTLCNSEIGNSLIRISAPPSDRLSSPGVPARNRLPEPLLKAVARPEQKSLRPWRSPRTADVISASSTHTRSPSQSLCRSKSASSLDRLLTSVCQTPRRQRPFEYRFHLCVGLLDNSPRRKVQR